tara:strand:- start:415 stop:894 length:480 start_codon:yes stop_codon:yes gene_type:complete
MKTTDIKIGDLIEFSYNDPSNFDKLKLKGLVTGINNDDLLPNNTTFTIRDEDKNSHTYYQYIKYEEEKMTNIHEVLELSKPLTDREKEIINFYENHIANMYSEVEDKVQDVRSKIDEATYELAGVEAGVFGDMEESLIEKLAEQEANERRKSIQAIVGK